MIFSKVYLKVKSLQAITISVLGFPLLGEGGFVGFFYSYSAKLTAYPIQSSLVSSVIKFSCWKSPQT